MIFREWHDFVVYPLEPDKVSSRAQRLDTSMGHRLQSNGEYGDGYTPSSPRGAVIPLSAVIIEDDQFEAMEIDDYGQVCVWTRDRVWALFRVGNEGGIEKLQYLPRHPST